MIRVVTISAGLGSPSSTRLLADLIGDATERAVAARGERAEVTVVELRPLARALADHLVTGFPAGDLAEALHAVQEADAVVAVTPVFAASYSGLFKTFFDVLEPGSLDGTPVLVAATAGTARHSLVLEHAMRPLFAHLRASPVPTGVFAASEDFGPTPTAEDAPGSRADVAGPLQKRVERAAVELAALLGTTDGGQVRPDGPRSVAEEFANPTPFATLLRRAGSDAAD